MTRFEIIPVKNKIFAKKSSLAIEMLKDTDLEFSFYVYNRRTHSIILRYNISLMEHCRDSMQNVSPFKKVKKK